MASIVIFHSALGLRPAVTGLRDLLTTDGHEVWTPDLFDGQVFTDLDAGIAERDRIGIPGLVGRAEAALDGLPTELIYIGVSMGTAPAQLMALTRPGARGVVLIQGALPLAALEVDAWPGTLPLQLHSSPDDPWHDADAITELTAAVPADLLDHRVYERCGHLFTDPGMAEYDVAATARLHRELRRWLRSRRGPGGRDGGRRRPHPVQLARST